MIEKAIKDKIIELHESGKSVGTIYCALSQFMKWRKRPTRETVNNIIQKYEKNKSQVNEDENAKFKIIKIEIMPAADDDECVDYEFLDEEGEVENNKMRHCLYEKKIKADNMHIFNNSFVRNAMNMHRQLSVLAKSLKYCQHGEPSDVLEIVEENLPTPKANQVLVKLLAAPINPADINTIQGKYPVKPTFPAIGGNECVGEVISVGDKVTKLQLGQRVVPFATGLGTWTTHAVYGEEHLMPVSNKIGIAEAATITVNPCTAYRMLKDFVQLSPGDCVIQNGANSAVGQAVHQLCKAWRIKSVGVVRDRPDIGQLKEYLKNLGATEVLTEEEMRTSQLFKSGAVKKPLLALNCVGGKSATEITRHLDNKGVIVTYGGMSREPVIAPTAALIFKDIAFRGFWMTRWTKENANSPQRAEMFDELCDLMEEGKFVAPVHEMVPLDKFREAVAAALNFKGFTGKKYILDMQ